MSETTEAYKTCRTCHWWKQSTMFRDGLPLGECRMKSPRTFQRQDERGLLMTRWPMTASLDFCGCHQNKRAATSREPGAPQGQGAGSTEQGGER